MYMYACALHVHTTRACAVHVQCYYMYTLTHRQGILLFLKELQLSRDNYPAVRREAIESPRRFGKPRNSPQRTERSC